MNNYLAGNKDNPHHISVGVVLMNDENKVACHFYKGTTIRNYPPDFYTLVHETMEPNESLEQTVSRGLQEEFSMKGNIERYIGTLVVEFFNQSVFVEKTVLYFLCRLISIDKVRDLSDPESISEIKWMDIDELILIMKRQGEVSTRKAGDESKILEDVKKYYL